MDTFDTHLRTWYLGSSTGWSRSWSAFGGTRSTATRYSQRNQWTKMNSIHFCMNQVSGDIINYSSAIHNIGATSTNVPSIDDILSGAVGLCRTSLLLLSMKCQADTGGGTMDSLISTMPVVLLYPMVSWIPMVSYGVPIVHELWTPVPQSWHHGGLLLSISSPKDVWYPAMLH